MRGSFRGAFIVFVRPQAGEKAGRVLVIVVFARLAVDKAIFLYR
jgi:hypothetical protein